MRARSGRQRKLVSFVSLPFSASLTFSAGCCYAIWNTTFHCAHSVVVLISDRRPCYRRGFLVFRPHSRRRGSDGWGSPSSAKQNNERFAIEFGSEHRRVKQGILLVVTNDSRCLISFLLRKRKG